MSANNDIRIEISDLYDFVNDQRAKDIIGTNKWVMKELPVVYFIKNKAKGIGYVGESTNFMSRLNNHLSNKERHVLNKISIIGSEMFHKSATLDLESSLIQYLSAEGTFELQNGNQGLVSHNYYNRAVYQELFKVLWSKMIDKKIIKKPIAEIENSELFKYSPYKALNADQKNSVIEILGALSQKQKNQIVVSGSAGTGKTIVASYLVKALMDDIHLPIDQEHPLFNDKELLLLKKFRENYNNPKIGLVIAMSSLRETMKSVFKAVPGLKPSMVISPSDTFKIKTKYDLLIVDEAHRLRKYKNISWRGAFKKNNEKLGLGDDGNELDWILENSRNQLFFYDKSQSVKPSDVDTDEFQKILDSPKTHKLELKSQMRIRINNRLGTTEAQDYITFVDNLLRTKLKSKAPFRLQGYELFMFKSFKTFYNELKERQSKYDLCRIVAGISWEWKSDPKKKPKPALGTIDFSIEGIELQWNQTHMDWINNPKNPQNPLNEIGCIHTVQGYDLNYVGVIFGREIDYNPKTGKIEILEENYLDAYGKNGTDLAELEIYIINIYKTMMYRGIKGTFVWAYHQNLRNYLTEHIPTFIK